MKETRLEVLYDSIYVTFWKTQVNKGRKPDQWGVAGRAWRQSGLGEVQGRWDYSQSVMVMSTQLDVSVKLIALYTKNSEFYCM